MAIRTHESWHFVLPASSPGELAEHAGRKIEADVLVARHHEGTTDAAGACTEIEHARARGNIEELCRVFDSSKAVMERRVAALFG